MGAGALSGRVITATGELPSRLRACLIPAEAANEDDMVRYACVDVTNDGAFALTHIAPGKYLIHTRQKEGNNQTWETIEKLHREPVAAKNEIEIHSCQHIKDYVLRYRP